jgi:arylsulfatase A-like enzyme
MIRKDDYKLMFFPQNKRMEFYNLKTDPHETTNLIDVNENIKLITLMYEELIKMQENLGDTLNLRRIFNKKVYK